MPRHTPEERKKNRLESQARDFERQREKDIRAREDAGQTNVGASRDVAEQGVGGFTPKPLSEPRTVEGVKQEKAELVTTLEKRGVFEADPERVELDPTVRSRSGSVPFIGSSSGAISNLLVTNSRFQKLYPRFKDDPEFQTLIQNPETQREIALQVIQQQVIDEGLSISERMGAIIEALPFGAGATARRVAGELISDPKGNVDVIVSTIESLGSQATNLGEKGGTAKVQPTFLLGQLDDFEKELVRLEQRLKILIESSAVLRENPDQVNKIETAILDARIRIKNNRDIIAAGAVTIPSNETLIIEMLKDERR